MRWAIAGLVLVAACASRGGTCPMTLVEESLFCPRCQVLVEGVDCATCDNPPVQAEVCIQSYFECTHHRPGHFDATECDQGAGCCTRVLSAARVRRRCFPCALELGPVAPCPNDATHPIETYCTHSGRWPHVSR